MVAAEGGDFDDLAAKSDVDDSKAPADDAGVAKQGIHFLGGGIGGDVEVLGVTPQEQVANRAADKVGLMPLAAQARHDLERVVADVLARDAVLVPGNDVQIGRGL